MIWHLNSLFHKEDTHFKEEGHARANRYFLPGFLWHIVIFAHPWASWHKNIHVQNPPLSQVKSSCWNLHGIVSAGSDGYSRQRSVMGCVFQITSWPPTIFICWWKIQTSKSSPEVCHSSEDGQPRNTISVNIAKAHFGKTATMPRRSHLTNISFNAWFILTWIWSGPVSSNIPRMGAWRLPRNPATTQTLPYYWYPGIDGINRIWWHCDSVAAIGDKHALRKQSARYNIVSGAENSGLSLDNRLLWDDL